MRHLDEDFRARLQSGVTKTCLCWQLTRTDGAIIGVTEHDHTVMYQGVRFEAFGALEAGIFTSSAALKPGQASAVGALTSDSIREEDLLAGKWDSARVDVFRVDWERQDLGVQIWSGRFSEITRSVNGFEAELVSLKADLERPVGRIYSRRCDAVLGDARCGVDTSDPEFSGINCDQRFETCKSRFRNAENFRGFPHMPGNDAVLAGPAATGNDGGKR